MLDGFSTNTVQGLLAQHCKFLSCTDTGSLQHSSFCDWALVNTWQNGQCFLTELKNNENF